MIYTGWRCDDRLVHASQSFSGTTGRAYMCLVENIEHLGMDNSALYSAKAARRAEPSIKIREQIDSFFSPRQTRHSAMQVGEPFELDRRHPAPSRCFKLVLTPSDPYKPAPVAASTGNAAASPATLLAVAQPRRCLTRGRSDFQPENWGSTPIRAPSAIVPFCTPPYVTSSHTPRAAV